MPGGKITYIAVENSGINVFMADNPKLQMFDALKLLSKTASDLLIEEQQLLDSELLRMSKLLREAIANLSECFSVMSNQISEQAAQLRSQSETGGTGADQNINALSSQQMSAFESRAVMALQFEDILQQLICHSRQRVEETENLLQSIHSNIEMLIEGDMTDVDAIMEILKTCQAEIGKTREALNLSHPAKQKSMTKGGATLF
ncbi:MAG: hypothetical protein A2W76_01380 [Gammaproteobacteria bacterium RIFCSPLOWO2_12_47_11]|nr:MAG: hypothetical protein A2W76_01380 [Gammaproteobacteria bacterium RIFCSPLOWO2_12_47_11]OGT83136.1 MAG: hypothetical protein A3G42_05760 [Gammaproteobacteria bacterium RIFCSPLOWO2_12_FULL_47_76]